MQYKLFCSSGFNIEKCPFPGLSMYPFHTQQRRKSFPVPDDCSQRQAIGDLGLLQPLSLWVALTDFPITWEGLTAASSLPVHRLRVQRPHAGSGSC